ncbi:hypothetical protein K8R32_03985 [bacterium]|nr:hypothetical protein [bacterium]
MINEEKIQESFRESKQETETDTTPELYAEQRTQEINNEINIYQGPKNLTEESDKINEIQQNYQHYIEEAGAEDNQETLQLFQNKMQEEVDFCKNEYSKFNDLEKLEEISKILKPADFKLFEKILGNKEGNTENLFDPKGKVIHASNSKALDIMSDSDINTISGGTRQLGPSFSDGDHDIAITFNLVWEKLKTPGGLDKTHKKIDLDEYSKFVSKYDEFVNWAIDRIKNEYGEGEKFEYEKNKLLEKAKEHYEDKSNLHDSEEQYKEELNGMAYEVLKKGWLKEGFSKEEVDAKVEKYINDQNRFKDRLENRPKNEQIFPVTLAFEKEDLPELVPEGGEREFEVRTEEEIKFDSASTIFVPEKYLNEQVIKKISQDYPGINIKTEEELEFIRMIKLLDKKSLE